MLDSAHVLLAWQGINVTSVPMGFMDTRMMAAHLVTAHTHRITATQNLVNVFALQTPMGQSVNTVMPTTGAMILSLDVWNATAAGKGQAGSSVTLQVASAHAERNLVGRHAMLVYLDIENTPTVFLVTVMPREPSLLGAMMNRKYAAVKKKLVPALARKMLLEAIVMNVKVGPLPSALITLLVAHHVTVLEYPSCVQRLKTMCISQFPWSRASPFSVWCLWVI